MTPAVDAALRSVADRLRAGDHPSARAAIERAAARLPDEHLLRAMAGMLACRAGDLDAGIAHLRRAVALAPDDAASRANLVTALIDSGREGEAEQALAAAGPVSHPRLARFAGWFHLRAERHGEAAAAYRLVLAADPADAESWNNLGNALVGMGEVEPALAAFRRAITLRPGEAQPRVNALQALAREDRREERLALARDSARAVPGDPELQLELGLAAAAMRDNVGAEASLRRAIELAPADPAATLELGLLYENLNRIDDLEALVAAARERMDAPELDFLHAWVLRRRNRFAAALPLARAAPDTVDPIRRYQLIGEVADRLGDADAAFDAFAAMKDATAAIVPPAMLAEGRQYLAEVRDHARQMTRAAVARWPDAPPAADPVPIFIAGFPRSGTTLLDTLLMNVPDLHVCEELTMMRAAELAAGDTPLEQLDAAAVERLRAAYFDDLARVSPPPPGTTVVDKFPLHMARLGLIHRLFPTARVIFCERHPADVLLSCYVSNFQPNRAMVNFLTLEGAAELYDAAFDAWTAATEALPVAVHAVRYERLVDDAAGEMQRLLAFLGRPFDASLIDNVGSAARRGQVRTASYAQVTEPIYRRSAGRWQRYRRQLAPVLPLLAPWVERMGYSLDPET